MYEQARCPECVSQGVVWCTLLPYERRRRKKIYVAAAEAGRCLRPPLESLDQMISAAGGAEEKAEVQLLLNCFELLAAAPLCLGSSSAAVGLPCTHSLTCCRSVTAADLVSMRERDEFGKGGRIQHTFQHCWAHVTERHWGGDKRLSGEERSDVICWGCNETRNCVRQKIE